MGSNTATAEGRKDENKSNKRILEKVEKNDLNFDLLHRRYLDMKTCLLNRKDQKESSRQSYKASTIIINESRVVNMSNLLVTLTLES